MLTKISIGIIIICLIVGGAGLWYKQKLLNNIKGEETTAYPTPTQSISNATTNDQIIQQLEKGPPAMEIDKNKQYEAILNTSLGDITIQLNAGATPITVNNFIVLAKKGFYDNVTFHRVIKGFMIQGGDPKGDGSGGPDYTFADELFEGKYTRGTVAMANAGPNTNGSQFFIMHQDNQLPKNYVIFGKVVSGMDVVDKIAEAPVKMSPGGEQSTPVIPAIINSVEIKEQ